MTGVVVIGRNEGERLLACLRSAMSVAPLTVYVDSGSTDGSLAAARAIDVEAIELDMNVPFTAARARNAGFRRLRELAPELRYVQFVDGDCEIVEGWFTTAVEFLDAHPQIGAVCGRRRERYPGRSLYNRLCDMEWDTPPGNAKACGGDAMFRVDAFEAVAGFRDDLIAGEEPELCVRLRAAGWRVWRLDAEMTLHDAAITRFGQWWSRARRAGHAFAEGAALHGAPPERHKVHECRSAWFWGLGMPSLSFLAVLSFGAWGLLALAVYPIQVMRIALRGSRSTSENWLRAVFIVLGKFPEMLGQVEFIARRLLGARRRLIEYK